MAALGIIKPGQADLTGDQHALNLKLFSGEVIAEFMAMSVAMQHCRSKPLKPGAKTEQFMVHGQIGSAYHVPGENILTEAGYLQQMRSGERLIHADRETLSPVVISKLLEKLNHWEDRAELAKEMARALSERGEANLFRTIARSARGYNAAPYTGAPTGTYISNGGALTAANILDHLLTAQQTMDEANVPEEDRVFFCRPSVFNTLLNSSATYEYIDKDLNPENGSLATGKVYSIAGFKLMKSNLIPSDNYTATDNQLSASVANDYRCDLSSSGTIGFCYQKGGVASVIGAEVGIESEYKLELRGDLVVGSYDMGHGELRPECCIEIAANAKPAAP